MAYTNFIPKIEWLKGTVTGTTAIGSPIVTAIANTSAIVTGAAYNMFFEGTGIPAGAVVLSKTVSTVTLNMNATAAATNTFSFGHRITFDHPPEGDVFDTQLKYNGSAAVSKSGLIQFIEDYTEEETKLKFSHITQVIKDRVYFFMNTHCLKGKPFGYFFDKGEPTSEVTVVKNESFNSPKWKLMKRTGAGYSFMWEFEINFQRVL